MTNDAQSPDPVAARARQLEHMIQVGATRIGGVAYRQAVDERVTTIPFGMRHMEIIPHVADVEPMRKQLTLHR